MRPTEGRTFINNQVFDEHRPIDLDDDAQVRYWAERLQATPAEIAQAIQNVGPNTTAVAIWLGSAGAV
jgi:hypothetical protein